MRAGVGHEIIDLAVARLARITWLKDGWDGDEVLTVRLGPRAVCPATLWSYTERMNQSPETTDEQKHQGMLYAWIGEWVTNPQSDEDRIAAQLAMDSIKFTKSGDLISPVAVAAIDILGMTV